MPPKRINPDNNDTMTHKEHEEMFKAEARAATETAVRKKIEKELRQQHCYWIEETQWRSRNCKKQQIEDAKQKWEDDFLFKQQ